MRPSALAVVTLSLLSTACLADEGAWTLVH